MVESAPTVARRESHRDSDDGADSTPGLGSTAGLGYGGSALGTGGSGSGRAGGARRVKVPKRSGGNGGGAAAIDDSVRQMHAQLATVDAAIARTGGIGGGGQQAELLSLRSNLQEAIALAEGQQQQNLHVAPSARPEGSACAVLCALPDGTGLWCRAVTLSEPPSSNAAGGRGGGGGSGVRVRIITPVCEDYRDREHMLQPSALRPDFEIVPATSKSSVCRFVSQELVCVESEW